MGLTAFILFEKCLKCCHLLFLWGHFYGRKSGFGCLGSQPLPWGCGWTMVRLPAVVSFWSCKKHPSRKWCQGWTKERAFENQDHGSHQSRTSEESIPGDGVSWENGVKWPERFSLETFQILQHQERAELCCKPLCPKTFPSSYFPNFCENKITSSWQSVVKI